MDNKRELNNMPRSVHTGDMDGDGDLDVLASSANLDKFSWWKNDGTPNNHAWVEVEIATSDNAASTIHAADIDGDGDLDMVGYFDSRYLVWYENTDGLGTTWGSTVYIDTFFDADIISANDMDGDGDLDVFAVDASGPIVWFENDGSPGDGSWTENTIDSSFYGTIAHVVDMDGDGDLDVLGSETSYSDVLWWENTNGVGTSWTQHTIDAYFSSTEDCYAGDIDGDGDIDVVACSSSSTDDVGWWENTAGSALYALSDTAPDQLLGGSADDDIMKIEVTHNGISGDNHLELNKWNFLLEVNTGTWGDMSTANAQGLFDNFHVYKDTGNGVFGGSGEDTQVLTIASASFLLSSGVQIFSFADDDSDAEIADTASVTYFLVIDMDASCESYANTNSITDVRFTLDPDADSLNDDDTEDSSISVADSSGTQVPFQPVPEFSDFVVPVFVMMALFTIYRKKRNLKKQDS